MSQGQKEQTTSLGDMLAAEMTQESISIRKMLERLPSDKMTWKPHEKSMTLERLAGHIVEMFMWTKSTLTQDELDFSKFDFTPKVYTDAADLVADLDKNIGESVEVLKNTANETMFENWTMRNGEQVYFTMPKAAVMRGFVMSHIIHHRGQLSVYMRLLDIPVPSIYGPSADEPM